MSKEGGKMRYNPNKHKRHSIRLKEYNYAKKGRYFITICIYKREWLLGKVKQDQMYVNGIGRIVEEELEKIGARFQYVNIEVYQVMPNHVHFILKIEKENKVIIGNIIRYLKGRVTSKAKVYWQRNYYERIIRNKEEYEGIYEYIKRNPENWKEDSEYL